MEIKDYITAAGVIVAVIVFSYNVRHNRRQIKISKLEEIIQLLSTLQNDYHYFAWCYIQSLVSEEEYENNPFKVADNEKYKEVLNHLTKNKDFYNNNITRLDVLANAYLKNDKLKLRILTFNNLMRHLAFALFFSDFRSVKKAYENGIPKNSELESFVHKTQNKLIKRMNLGHNNLSLKKRIAYRENEFLKDAGIS